MAEVTESLPGMRAVYTQPIEMRINEMVAGIRADLGIKLYGDDLETLKAKAEEIEKVVKSIPGAADTTTEQVTGLPVLRIRVDNEALSRYGVPAQQVLDAVKAVGGIDVGEIIEPGRRFPLVVRLPMAYREDPQALEQISIPTASGQRLPLTQLVRIEEEHGTIDHPTRLGRAADHRADERQGPRHRLIRQGSPGANRPRGRTSRSVTRIEWGGQFEHLERAEKRLYHRRAAGPGPDPQPALSHVPLAPRRRDDFQRRAVRPRRRRPRPLCHGPAVHHLGRRRLRRPGRGVDPGRAWSSSAAIRDRMAHGVPKREAIEQARLARLRPVLMTGTVAALGFVPMMLSTGIGAEVQRPLATVVVFGMACDTFLTMLALPVLYLLFGKGPQSVSEPGKEERLSKPMPVPAGSR